MKKIMLLFVLLAFATPLFASDPFVGSWKLNSAKTQYTAGSAPKAVMIVVEEQDKNLHITASGTASDGAPIKVSYTVPKEGGAATVETGEEWDSIMVKRIDDHTRENTYMKAGTVIMTRKLVIAEDGKTMTSIVEGTNAKGVKVSGTDFYDRQ